MATWSQAATPRCQGNAKPIIYTGDDGRLIEELVQCSRRTIDPSGYCYLHRRQAARRGQEARGE